MQNWPPQNGHFSQHQIPQTECVPCWSEHGFMNQRLLNHNTPLSHWHYLANRLYCSLSEKCFTWPAHTVIEKRPTINSSSSFHVRISMALRSWRSWFSYTKSGSSAEPQQPHHLLSKLSSKSYGFGINAAINRMVALARTVYLTSIVSWVTTSPR